MVSCVCVCGVYDLVSLTLCDAHAKTALLNRFCCMYDWMDMICIKVKGSKKMGVHPDKIDEIYHPVSVFSSMTFSDVCSRKTRSPWQQE